jgi:hypothetical protein
MNLAFMFYVGGMSFVVLALPTLLVGFFALDRRIDRRARQARRQPLGLPDAVQSDFRLAA